MTERPILRATGIAAYVFGDPNRVAKIYYLARIGRLPVRKFGAILFALPSELDAAIAGMPLRTRPIEELAA